MKKYRVPLRDVNGEDGFADIVVGYDTGIGQIVDMVRAELKDPTGNVWIGWPAEVVAEDGKQVLHITNE